MRIVAVVVCTFLVLGLNAQENFRLRADVTIKEVNSKTNVNILWKGKVYYDKPTKTILYDFTFPKPTKWLLNDERVYDIRRDTVRSENENVASLKFSLFHLVLENNLTQYGLDKTIFELGETKRDGDLVISIWKPKSIYASGFGEVHISVKDGQLYGVLTYDKDGRLERKQFFRNYQDIRNVFFPTELIEILYYKDGAELKRLTTYSNIFVNELENEEYYHFDISKLVVADD